MLGKVHGKLSARRAKMGAPRGHRGRSERQALMLEDESSHHWAPRLQEWCFPNGRRITLDAAERFVILEDATEAPVGIVRPDAAIIQFPDPSKDCTLGPNACTLLRLL